MGGLVIKGPNGSDAVIIQQSTNVTKVVEASDIASDAFVKGRMGTGGAFSFRNKIIDGRFDFWYEGTSQTTSGYGSSTMWFNANTGSTKTTSRQALTVGVDLPALEVPSATYFHRTVVTSVTGASNLCLFWQNIEDVRTLAGKTVTLSFYAKADAVRNIAIDIGQYFGTGGSTPVAPAIGQIVSLSTTWKRYSVTGTLPSVSGKTINATDSLLGVDIWFDAGTGWATRSSSLGQQSGTFDIACIQLEEGSVATPFEELPIEISQTRVFRYYRPVYLSGSGYFAAADYIRGNTFGGVVGDQVMRTSPTISGSFTETYNVSSITVTESRYLAYAAASGTAYFQWSGKADARL